jgi:hypothetical protein
MTLILIVGVTGLQYRVDDRPLEVRVVFKGRWPPLEEMRVNFRYHLIIINLFPFQLTALA